MARQQQRLRIRLLTWLPCSVFGVFCLFGIPALGWDIDTHNSSVIPEPSTRFENDTVLQGLDGLPTEALPQMTRKTLAWHEDLLKMLRHQKMSPQVLRSPVPSAEAVCASLEGVLPYFDLAAEQLPQRLRQRLCQRVRTYAVRYRRDVQVMLYRADTYLPMIKRMLREHALPTYYAYIPLVESAFQVDARHGGSGARGLWQLLSHTARTCGLTVSKSIDDRLHPKRSTEAAVTYLAHLQKRFGTHGPLYVLAAYNHGETNLSRKMRRFSTHDVPSLYRLGRLPAETREYLLRMMTMWVITTHPGRFHFLLREAVDPPLPLLDDVPRNDLPVGVAEGDELNK